MYDNLLKLSQYVVLYQGHACGAVARLQSKPE